MSTIRYSDFLQAYNQEKFTNTHRFSLMLVSDDYLPSENDSVSDVTGVLLKVPIALTWLQFTSSSMGEIYRKLTEKTSAYVIQNTDKVSDLLENVNTDFSFEKSRAKYLVLYSPSLNILCFCEEIL